MKSLFRYGAAALALMSSVAVASAATIPMTAKVSDTLKLTSAQEHTIYQSASQQQAGTKPPAGFTAAVGSAVPAKVILHPLPMAVTDKIAAARPYEYAMLDKKLLIVNPIDKKVVDIITQ